MRQLLATVVALLALAWVSQNWLGARDAYFAAWNKIVTEPVIEHMQEGVDDLGETGQPSVPPVAPAAP